MSTRPFVLQTTAGERKARALLVATGSAPRRLSIPGEREFFTKGVSYCAVCDGPLYGGKRLMVVGGGNTAVEEALFLTGIASEVVLVHRRDELRADRILQERVAQNAKITLRWNEVLEEILGHEVLTGVRVRNVKTQETASCRRRDSSFPSAMSRAPGSCRRKWSGMRLDGWW